MSATLLRLVRVFLYAALTLPLMPLQAALVVMKSPLQRRLPLFYHGWVIRLMGFRVTVTGEPSGAGRRCSWPITSPSSTSRSWDR